MLGATPAVGFMRVDHAGQLESASKDFSKVRNASAILKKDTVEALASANENISKVFARVDDLLGQLQAGDTALAAQLETRASALEAAVHELIANGVRPDAAPGLPGAAVNRINGLWSPSSRSWQHVYIRWARQAMQLKSLWVRRPRA